MRDVLISLKPYYYYLIGENIKKVEVRKSYPKAEDWSRNSWFYMSRDEKSFAKIPKEFQEKYRKHFGKVGMRFVCDKIDEYPFCPYICEDGTEALDLSGYEIPTVEGEKTGMDYGEAAIYGKGKPLYFWHITDLIVYDEPRELSDFKHECNGICIDTKNKIKCSRITKYGFSCNRHKPITRPPMSWQFCVDTEPRQMVD